MKQANASKEAQSLSRGIAFGERAAGKGIAAQQAPVQMAIDYTGSYSTATLPGIASTPNTVQVTGTNMDSGSPRRSEVFAKGTQAQTQPFDPIDFDVWKNYVDDTNGYLGLLKEPSRNVNLTRMHAINGVFYGPSQADNMFLGTQKSNNSGSGSHLHQVENPIKNFLTGVSDKFGVHYTVIPDYSAAPDYILDRADDITNTTDDAAFREWARQACPKQFSCSVSFYKKVNPTTIGGAVTYKSHQEIITLSAMQT